MINPCDVNTVRCAGCGKLREQANHWFLIWMDHGPRQAVTGFHCHPFELAQRRPDDLPVCGQACAQKEFEKWMSDVRNGFVASRPGSSGDRMTTPAHAKPAWSGDPG